jgi:hypothetical protein
MGEGASYAIVQQVGTRVKHLDSEMNYFANVVRFAFCDESLKLALPLIISGMFSS